jgi:hypothetical protein
MHRYTLTRAHTRRQSTKASYHASKRAQTTASMNHKYIHTHTQTHSQVTHESIIQCFKSGANDFINKPFHGEELREKLNVHLKIKNGINSRLGATSIAALTPSSAVVHTQTPMKAGTPEKSTGGSQAHHGAINPGQHIQHAPGTLVTCVVLYIHMSAPPEDPSSASSAGKSGTYIVGNARMISAMTAQKASKDMISGATITLLASRLSELARTYSLHWTSLGDALVAYAEVRAPTEVTVAYESVISAALSMADAVVSPNISADVRMSVQRGVLRCADTPHGRTMFGQAYSSARKMVDKSAHLSIVVSQRVRDELPQKYQCVDSEVTDDRDASIARLWVLKDRRLAWEQCANDMQAAARNVSLGGSCGASRSGSALANVPIKSVLDSVGLGHLMENFEREEITSDLISECSDDMLKELGVTSMGARVRLKKTVASMA